MGEEQNYEIYVEADGKLLEIRDIAEFSVAPDNEMQTEVDEVLVQGCVEGEVELKTEITLKTILVILGIPTSNNWRRMHGGIMDRKQRKNGGQKNSIRRKGNQHRRKEQNEHCWKYKSGGTESLQRI